MARGSARCDELCAIGARATWLGGQPGVMSSRPWGCTQVDTGPGESSSPYWGLGGMLGEGPVRGEKCHAFKKDGGHGPAASWSHNLETSGKEIGPAQPLDRSVQSLFACVNY